MSAREPRTIKVQALSSIPAINHRSNIISPQSVVYQRFQQFITIRSWLVNHWWLISVGFKVSCSLYDSLLWIKISKDQLSSIYDPLTNHPSVFDQWLIIIIFIVDLRLNSEGSRNISLCMFSTMQKSLRINNCDQHSIKHWSTVGQFAYHNVDYRVL